LAGLAATLVLTGADQRRAPPVRQVPRDRPAVPLRQEEIKVQGEVDHPRALPLTPPRSPVARTTPPESFLSKVLEAAEKEPF
jgi:hypothetical protein